MAEWLASRDKFGPIGAMENVSSRGLITLFRLLALRLSEARAELGALDGAIGDADHGNSMADGFSAVVQATSSLHEVAPAKVMSLAATSFLSAVGATTGPLYASAMLSAARSLDGTARLTPQAVALLVPAFHDGIASRGKARPGDKTMIDVWAPAARAVADSQKSGLSPLESLHRALDAATEGREATRAMMAAVGRAARLGPRSIGHVDPGAASAVILIAAMLEWVQRDLQSPPEGME